MEDKEIIARVLRGNKDDFGLLVNKYSVKIYRICLSLCGNDFDAADATQETFIDAFLYLSSLSDTDKFASWLCSIARRKSYKQFSFRRSDEDIDAMEEFLPSLSETPLDISISEERNRRVREAAGRLPDKKRVVVEMFYFRGMKIGEISKKLSLSENTVKSRLYDAREQLRKELYDMSEHNDNISLLESKIKSKLKKLSRYYALYGSLDEKFDSEVDETMSLIEKIDDVQSRQGYTASVLYYKSWSDKLDNEKRKELKERAQKFAEDGKNLSVITSRLINECLGITDNEQGLSFIDNVALPKIDEFAGAENYDSERGSLLFWRGRRLLMLKRLDEAKEDFKKASELIDKSSSYHANALAALREIDYMRENAYDVLDGFSATAEGFILDGNRVIFYNQPGFSELTCFRINNNFKSFMYYAASCRHTLFDVSMKPNDMITDDKNNSSLECIAIDEDVSVASGNFKGCLHMRTKGGRYAGYTLDAWYASGVGLVKVIASARGKTERYELSEYNIKGGKGYMPFALGNRWVYISPDIPDWVYYRIERTVEYTDGELTNISVISPFTLAKNFESAEELDSSVYLSLAKQLCTKWKIEEAIGMLKKAVRLNVNEQATRISLYGIEVLNRFSEYHKKGYRICPSSINASTISASEGIVKYIEPSIISFGPYQYGGRGRYEDRIFGIKPFRYLHRFMGTLWSDKWVPGYSEEKELAEGLKLVFTVSDGGSITVPAGSFDNCRKITFLVDKPAGADERWYFNNWYSHIEGGIKEYWFAPGVGIVKVASTWESECYAECLLGSYSVLSSNPDEYLPIQIGNSWEYDEPHLTEEGYRAKAIFRIPSGINGEYLMTSSQEFVCFKTEEEYKEFVKISHKY